ncbi:MAG: FAD-dependent oxidoreductase [Chloroflexota bacterium]|nr:FAD-dependent oxidoreductase [Chloroflexota bacterium]
MSDRSDVVIVGGGIIGCGIAYELAKRGVAVTVVERGPIGGEASWASAGIIGIPSRPEWTTARVDLHRISLARYPTLRAELRERSAINFDYVQPGDLAIAVDAQAAARRRTVADWQRVEGFAIEELTIADARRREPALPADLQAVWLAPTAGSLSAHRFTLALATAAASLGATILPDTPAGELLLERNKVRGVRLLDRDLTAETVILATGAWTRFFGQRLNADLPTRPVKGQLIAFARAPLQPRHILSGHGGYVRPRGDGTTLVAATEEHDAGFDRRVTGEGVAWLLDLTRALCPVLLQGEVVQTWTGLRPGTDTVNPMIGPVPGHDGLWVAAGHFRSGAVEAPGTAELVATAIATGTHDPLLAAFAPPTVAGIAR